MNNAISMDRAGRVVLPQAVRRHFHLTPGDQLQLEMTPDGILLRSPLRQANLVEENGLLVCEGEPVGDLLGAVEVARLARMSDVMGLDS